MNEQNKKATYDGMDRKKKDDTIIKNGVIQIDAESIVQIDAESIVFAKGSFRLMTINKPQKVTGKGVGGKRQ